MSFEIVFFVEVQETKNTAIIAKTTKLFISLLIFNG
jgi:hypothetical protein